MYTLQNIYGLKKVRLTQLLRSAPLLINVTYLTIIARVFRVSAWVFLGFFLVHFMKYFHAKMTFFETPYYQKHVFDVHSISRKYLYNMIKLFFVQIKFFFIFFVFHKMSRNVVKCRLRPLKSYFYQKYVLAELIQSRVNISTMSILQNVLEIKFVKYFFSSQNVEKCRLFRHFYKNNYCY